jgi:hypothetical protein
MRGSEKTARKRPIRHQINGQISGQISIVAAALMGTTFFLFFAFVVNTGMLVHAKINLQNAADVAAYAGAASQARHLENIGILNYELRRQYKRFLFRYYVIGNLTRPNEPAGGEYRFGAYRSGTNPRQFVNLGIPAVCLEFKKNDNYCAIYDLQPVTAPDNPFFLDAIGQALKEVLDNIEQIRKRNCSGLSQANILALYLWLYNTNPDGSGNLISSTFNDPETRQALRTLPAITKGLGVVPRNLITLQRIKTLEKIVNMPAERGVTSDGVRSLEQKPNPMTYERTVLAFKSAERTLGGSLFPEGKFQMDELLPSGAKPLLELEPLFSSFTTYATYIAATDGNAKTDCKQRLLSIPIRDTTLPVGASKVGPTTYYAVRVRGTPNLLFNPFNLTLEAFAAARPFGARLGPAAAAGLNSEFFIQKDPIPPANLGSVGSMTGGSPNMAFRPGDSLGLYNTALFRGLVNYIKSGSGETIDPNRLVQAEAIAALPNQAEYGRYIIPTDYNSAGDQPPNALDYKNYFVNGSSYSFYAPVSLDGGANARSEVENILTQHPEPEGLSGLKSKLRKDLNEYFGRLGTNSGEGGEGIQIARVMDPMRDITGADVSGLAGTIIPKITNGELRPWFSGRDLAPLRSQNGRVGYSVKLVSFKSLQSSGVSVSGAESDPTPYIDH